MKKEVTPDSQESENSIPLGEQLKEAREAADLGVEDVAKKLFLTADVVKELENDTIAKSTSVVFIKGYVKSYSILLGLDVDETLAIFQAQYQGENDVKQMQTFSNRTKANAHNSYLNGITLAVLVMMVLAVSGWWWQQTNEPIKILPQTSNYVSDDEPSPLLPLVPDVTPLAEQAQVMTEIYTLSFSSDCWVKIVDATNAVIAVGIKKANSSIEVTGVAPLDVILGAPNAVTITSKEQTLDISSYIVKDTAIFTLPLGK